jgi:hypothetical protein
MVVVYSTTKGLAAMTLALAHSRGWLDYEERVSTYWPEFARQGKERITVGQLLAHQAGLFELDETINRGLVRDLDRLAGVLARQKPAWEPGTRQTCLTMTSASTRGISRCRPVVLLAPREPPRMHTPSLPPEGMSWDCDERRWTCWPHPRSHQRAASMTMLKGRGSLLAWLHEAEPRVAVRKPQLVWRPWRRRVLWLC